MDYQKVKSVAKEVVIKGPRLDQLVLRTMETIASIVGATLGPGGQPVLIERFEHGMPATVTKDGVTVFRALGFDDPTAHVVMEAARDAAVRTAGEAGDGTTSATVLAEAIVRLTNAYCRANPKVSPQGVVRRLEQVFQNDIEPLVLKCAISAQLDDEKGRALLHGVACISANGDKALADAVMECFDLVGDDGNVTLTEVSGPSRYEVERIDGYPIEGGYEDSCGKFYGKFINDPGTQRCVLENPVFVLYHGRITEMQTLVNLMMQLGGAWGSGRYDRHNVVIFATGFSESVLGQLALNFAEATTINVLPMLVPRSPVSNGQLQFLQDLAAVTGAQLFDPLNAPLEAATIGNSDMMGREEITAALDGMLGPGVKSFEASRFRSNILGHAEGEFVGADGQPHLYEELIAERAAELETLIENPESQLDKMLLQERLGKLTAGIAKLRVLGSSSGELREKRDRAEDAVCSVRGAMRHGCLPGGGWTLLRLINMLGTKYPEDAVVRDILIPALTRPVTLLLQNTGVPVGQEMNDILMPVQDTIRLGKKTIVWDAMQGRHVDPVKTGILDSVPAVLEAIRNSLSIASLLGTLGGAITFKRDGEFERSEARANANWLRDAGSNPADERG